MAQAFGYSFDRFTDGPDEAAGEEIIALWSRHGAVPDIEAARKRLRQVVTIARDTGGAVVGVCTAPVRDVPRFRCRLYFYRSFVSPEARQAGVATELLAQARDHLESLFAQRPKVQGIYMQIENEHIKRVKNDAIWKRTRFVFVGFNDGGDHLRVYWFADAKID
jgi:GNAT superfamily N-acetyltransferase